MLNQIILVGRLAKKVEVEERENGGKFGYVTLAVPRTFKNVDGVYDTDFIDCVLYGSIAENTKEYCEKGDIVGIKGRIQKLEGEEMKLIAEKVTFLTSKPKEEE